jgi:hypothetical protein
MGEVHDGRCGNRQDEGRKKDELGFEGRKHILDIPVPTTFQLPDSKYQLQSVSEYSAAI